MPDNSYLKVIVSCIVCRLKWCKEHTSLQYRKTTDSTPIFLSFAHQTWSVNLSHASCFRLSYLETHKCQCNNLVCTLTRRTKCYTINSVALNSLKLLVPLPRCWLHGIPGACSAFSVNCAKKQRTCYDNSISVWMFNSFSWAVLIRVFTCHTNFSVFSFNIFFSM